jgi:hypothetical protein
MLLLAFQKTRQQGADRICLYFFIVIYILTPNAITRNTLLTRNNNQETIIKKQNTKNSKSQKSIQQTIFSQKN